MGPARGASAAADDDDSDTWLSGLSQGQGAGEAAEEAKDDDDDDEAKEGEEKDTLADRLSKLDGRSLLSSRTSLVVRADGDPTLEITSADPGKINKKKQQYFGFDNDKADAFF